MMQNTSQSSARWTPLRGLLSLCAVLALSLPIEGAAQPAQVTVDMVISMHKSGLPAPIIMQTISQARFNLSLADKQRLERAGVPQAIIDAMVGGDSPVPEPEPEPMPEDPLARMEAEQAAMEAASEEERRIQEAARQAMEVEKRRLAAEEAARVRAQLEGAFKSYEAGRYHEAARAFSEFLATNPTKPESLAQGKLGLANSLFKLGLFGNAAVLYEEILSVGPSSPSFDEAFLQLRACAKEISYNRLSLSALTANSIIDRPQEFQDSYNFFLGQFFFNSSDYTSARTYLEAVKGGADYSRARYILGLILVEEAGDDFGQLIRANRFFQEAITHADRSEESKSLVRIKHLSYLALARIAYTLGRDIPSSYDAAIFYYRKIPSESTSYIHAVYESAWAYFLKGNIRRGMGLFHTLEGPDWENYYLPDTYLLEAQVFLNLCQVPLAEAALRRVVKHYFSLRPQLDRYIEQYMEPLEMYQAFVEGKLVNGVKLPRRFRLAIISNPLFRELFNDVSRYRNEVGVIEEGRVKFGMALTEQMLEVVSARKQEETRHLGTELIRMLEQVQQELGDLETKMREIEVELLEKAQDALDAQIAATRSKQSSAAESEASVQDTASLFVGDRYVTWPFEGEFWNDEVNSYRSYLTSQCPEIEE